MSLFFSLSLPVCAQIPIPSPREKPGKTREGKERERERERAGCERQKVRGRLRSENQSVHLCVLNSHTDALWWSCQQTADSPRFLRALLLGCPGVHQRDREREVSTAASVCVRGYTVCVPSANEGVCLCGKEAKGTT